MNELVSVVIPSYNRADSILTCVDSIVKQSYPNLEIIVIDDGSKDNTAEVIKDYIDKNSLKKLFFYQQANQGAPSARNNGLSKAKGNLVVFFDSDDLMLPDRIVKQVKSILEEKSDCCACGFVNSQSGEKYIPHINQDLGNIGSLIDWSLMGSTQSWMYKRDILVDMGGYDTAYACYQDWDLTFRYLTQSNKVSVVKEALSVFVDDENADRITSQIHSIKRTPHIQRYYLKVLKWLAEHGGKPKSVNHLLFLYANEITLKYYRSGNKKLSIESYRSFSYALKETSFFTKLRFKAIYLIHLIKLLRH